MWTVLSLVQGSTRLIAMASRDLHIPNESLSAFLVTGSSLRTYCTLIDKGGTLLPAQVI